jgi:hypothetical protein
MNALAFMSLGGAIERQGGAVVGQVGRPMSAQLLLSRIV